MLGTYTHNLSKVSTTDYFLWVFTVTVCLHVYMQNYFPCAIEEVLGKRNWTRKLANILNQGNHKIQAFRK